MGAMKTMGEIAFDAYNKAKGGKTWDGRDIPAWTDLGNDVREAWEAAALAVFRYWDELAGEEE